jgi:hypothetical protein
LRCGARQLDRLGTPLIMPRPESSDKA